MEVNLLHIISLASQSYIFPCVHGGGGERGEGKSKTSTLCGLLYGATINQGVVTVIDDAVVAATGVTGHRVRVF